MKYYSTNKTVPEVTLSEAVVKGLAADKGLFMPERIEKLLPIQYGLGVEVIARQC